jgi:hypothetical protein
MSYVGHFSCDISVDVTYRVFPSVGIQACRAVASLNSTQRASQEKNDTNLCQTEEILLHFGGQVEGDNLS